MRKLIEGNPDRFFAWSVAAILLVKVLLALAVPLTGDEAYFLLWGKNLDFGYYDHPPMVGWIVALLAVAGDSLFVYRLFPLAVTLGIGIGIHRLLRETDRVAACLVGLIFLLSPVSVLNVIISTDTPLILFVFLSAVFFARGLKKESYGSFALAGFFLGLAFLSKYFAVLLLPAFAWAAAARKSRKALAGLAVTALAAFPLAAVNIYWNYSNCWANILFNLLARTRSSSLDFSRLPAFVAMQVYVLMPWTLYHFWRSGKRRSGGGRSLSPYALCYTVPFLILAALSVKKSIGLHWMASFTPFFFLLLHGLERDRLLATVKYSLVFALLHVTVALSLLSLPPELFREHRKYGVIRLHVEPEEACRELKLRGKGTTLASDSYSIASILSYHCEEKIAVLGSTSKYGRADDKFTDLRELKGKDVTLISLKKPDADKYRPYFREARAERVEVEGAPYTFVSGRGFDLEAYREGFLEGIRERYYRLPAFLPEGDCYFLDRYFGETGESQPD